MNQFSTADFEFCANPRPDVDTVGFDLERLQTFLAWIEEHRASYEALKESDVVAAEREMNYLKDSIVQAVGHLHRLSDLLVAGKAIDPTKKLPRELNSSHWIDWANRLLQEKKAMR